MMPKVAVAIALIDQLPWLVAVIRVVEVVVVEQCQCGRCV